MVSHNPCKNIRHPPRTVCNRKSKLYQILICIIQLDSIEFKENITKVDPYPFITIYERMILNQAETQCCSFS